LPCIIAQSRDAGAGEIPNVYGDLDGVFWVSGAANASENTFTISADNYIVFQDCFRTGNSDFCAVRLD
jgi:hypothetical protein